MHFTNYLAGLQLQPSSIKHYNTYAGRFLSWLQAEELPASECTYNDLLAYIRSLQDAGSSKRMQSGILGALRHYFTYQVQVGQRSDNPAAGVFIKGITRKLPANLLSVEEMQTLYQQYSVQLQVAAAKKVMLGLLVYQGLTVAELMRLEAGSIKLEAGQVYISGTKHSNARWLPLSAVQTPLLQKYLQEHRYREGALFVNGRKREISARNVNNNIKYMMEQLQVFNPRVINAQQFRSSVITHWLKQHNLRQVQYMAGHKYVSSTQRYEQCNLDGLLQAVARYHPMK